jgi:hypothetical protein
VGLFVLAAWRKALDKIVRGDPDIFLDHKKERSRFRLLITLTDQKNI